MNIPALLSASLQLVSQQAPTCWVNTSPQRGEERILGLHEHGHVREEGVAVLESPSSSMTGTCLPYHVLYLSQTTQGVVFVSIVQLDE